MTTFSILLREPMTINLQLSSGQFSDTGQASIELPACSAATLRVDGAQVGIGYGASVVTVSGLARGFSFFLRDVSQAWPIYLPDRGVIVCCDKEERAYQQIADSLHGSEFSDQAEPCLKSAMRNGRDQISQCWLGFGRDLRTFRAGYNVMMQAMGVIGAYDWQGLASVDGSDMHWVFVCGRGASCQQGDIERRLEDGVLPILHMNQCDNGIRYEATILASMESGPISTDKLPGTPWQQAYANTAGHMLAQTREELRAEWNEEAEASADQPICWLRIAAHNRTHHPQYAWYHLPVTSQRWQWIGEDAHGGQLDAQGRLVMADGRVLSINRVDGAPLRDLETAVLVHPGEQVIFEAIIPHRPLSDERAQQVAGQDFTAHLEGCRQWWTDRLATAASIALPEQAIDERLQAGLLHLDLATLGEREAAPLLATVGIYCPIGSESLPIVLTFDALGWHEQAARCIDFFLARQDDRGFIQCFNNYEAETGPVLCMAGHHWQVTRDRDWAMSRAPALLRSVEFLRGQRAASLAKHGLPEHIRGMIPGKVADRDIYTHAFFLNAHVVIGLRLVADIIAQVDTTSAAAITAEAEALAADCRRAFFIELERSPVLPLADGSWAAMPPPWPGQTGPSCLHVDAGPCYSHGSMMPQDSLIGALPLVQCGVLAPDDAAVEEMLAAHRQLCTVDNAALSQPYYARHDWAYLARGEANAFLEVYYHQIAGMQDRSIYEMFEHCYQLTQHKTHEEGWMLQQTLWMLARQDADGLHLLGGIPRAWLAEEAGIHIDGLCLPCGRLHLRLVPLADRSGYRLNLHLDAHENPTAINIRIPDPEGRSPQLPDGSRYKADRDCLSWPGSALDLDLELLYGH